MKKRAKSINTSNIVEENTRDAACGKIKGMWICFVIMIDRSYRTNYI